MHERNHRIYISHGRSQRNGYRGKCMVYSRCVCNHRLLNDGKENYMSSLDANKCEAKRTARDLGYGNDVINRISKATSENEITRIMISARHNMKD